ncbi:hypothetical protein B0I22_2325 [Epilithonimonas xixisoli]|uniref:Uncharacterized protein n=1 Tax=Epilithonimonas xixisoli TaxID=1476462 RepID=A0A4R8I6T7_9FLAO|nr:hypothetical protein B0I22_2325 [Epilithonimonas xixisoli]
MIQVFLCLMSKKFINKNQFQSEKIQRFFLKLKQYLLNINFLLSKFMVLKILIDVIN